MTIILYKQDANKIMIGYSTGPLTDDWILTEMFCSSEHERPLAYSK